MDAVDQRLAEWEERLRRIDDNLLALENDDTYQLLARGGAKLAGVTQARVVPALATLARLFEARERLTEVLARAKEIRASMSTLAFWENESKLRQIDELLAGPSIHLGTHVKPLAQRTLLDESTRDVAASPVEVIGDMARDFEAARDVVLQVTQAWSSLEPSMARMDAELARLRRAAEALGERAKAAELGPLEKDVAALAGRVADDPLGVTDDVATSILPRLEAVRARIDLLAVTKERAAGMLAKATRLRAELAERRAAPSTIEAEFRGVAAAVERVGEADVEGVDAWRAKLDATMHEGRFGPAEVGAARLVEALEVYVANERAVADAYDALVARRAEMTGLLSARRAQADALVARGAALDAAAAAHAARAAALLKQRPTPLDEAAAELAAYERHVAAASAAARARR